MFIRAKPAGIIATATFSALKNAKTTIIKTDDYDVFGDGTVIIKSAPGHTPGHQVLFLKLAKTGPLLVAGDLYHYPEERTTGNVPTFEFNKEQSLASRAAIEDVPEEDQGANVDRARCRHFRHAQEGSGVLRIGARADSLRRSSSVCRRWQMRHKVRMF